MSDSDKARRQAWREIDEHIDDALRHSQPQLPTAWKGYEAHYDGEQVQLTDVVFRDGRRLSQLNGAVLWRVRQDCWQPLNDISYSFDRGRTTYVATA